jgi:hypothetical protein
VYCPEYLLHRLQTNRFDEQLFSFAARTVPNAAAIANEFL